MYYFSSSSIDTTQKALKKTLDFVVRDSVKLSLEVFLQYCNLTVRAAKEILISSLLQLNCGVVYIQEGRKALNTLYLPLYGVGHMVICHTYSERKPAAATWATLYD